jgi:hypothetical protein
MCTRPSKQPRKGCPTCEFTIQYKIFLHEMEQEFRRGAPTHRDNRKWPVRHMLDVYAQVAAADAAVRGKGQDRKWSVVTAILVSIVRDERGKSDAVDYYNDRERAAAIRRGEDVDDDGEGYE